MMENVIATIEFCKHYHVEYEFITMLQESGLIETRHIDEQEYLDLSKIDELEKFSRMYYDLEINVSGIEAIHHLLSRVRDMQDEITLLRNRLRIYE